MRKERNGESSDRAEDIIGSEKLPYKDYKVRRMTVKDIPEVLEIENISYSHPWTEAAFKGEIDNFPISHPYVIIYNPLKKVIGYVIFWHLFEEIQISNIAVHPEFRRKGIARRVLEWLIEESRYLKARFMILEVRPSNKGARTLYKRLGFRIEGIRKGYYQNPWEDALLMRLRLKSKESIDDLD